MTTTPDALTTAEQALGIMASHGDECAAALITELERLRAIEAAAREAARTLHARTDEVFCRPCEREYDDGVATHVDTDGCLYCATHATPSSLPLSLLRKMGGAK